MKLDRIRPLSVKLRLPPRVLGMVLSLDLGRHAGQMTAVPLLFQARTTYPLAQRTDRAGLTKG